MDSVNLHGGQNLNVRVHFFVAQSKRVIPLVWMRIVMPHPIARASSFFKKEAQ
jgi:hypothetical protein